MREHDDQMEIGSSSPPNLQNQVLIQQHIQSTQTQQQQINRTTTPQQISSPPINSPGGVKLFYMNSSPQIISSPIQARPGSLPASSNLVATFNQVLLNSKINFLSFFR